MFYLLVGCVVVEKLCQVSVEILTPSLKTISFGMQTPFLFSAAALQLST